MPTYQAAFFQITAQTNLHVGSGSQNYGIIDNLIQRDPLTGYPYIQASSLKGSLRQLCTAQWGEKDDNLRYIFGRETNDDQADQASSAGNFVFLDARLLSIPVRTDQTPYLNLTSSHLITDFQDTLKNFAKQLPTTPINQNIILTNFSQQLASTTTVAKQYTTYAGEITLENTDIIAQQVPQSSFNVNLFQYLLGTYPALITNRKPNNSDLDASYPEDLFKLLTDDFHLPVVARNKVATRDSEKDDSNLWYEQILPRQTRFYFGVLYPVNAVAQYNLLTEVLATSLVQIGANASVGYGFCQITLITTEVLPSNTEKPKKP